MAKIAGNSKVTFPSDKEILEKGTKENLCNLKQKINELKQFLKNDKSENTLFSVGNKK